MRRSIRKCCVSLVLLIAPLLCNASDHVAKAEKALAAKNYRMAVVHYQRALRETPDDMTLMLGLAGSYERWGRNEKAHQIALEITAEDATHIETLLLLARMAARTKEWPKAEMRYRQVLAEEPGHLEASSGLVEVLEAQGKYTEATKLANEGHK